jgi:pimeloyl-ACP methyl ester carboxylesterase
LASVVIGKHQERVNAPAALHDRVAALLATAELHRTPLPGGTLCWQHWSAPDAGPPLVLLHGGFGSWNHWFANIDGLREHRDLWTVDLPGLGDSGPIGRGATVQEFVAHLQRGIRVLLGERDYALAGFSFGALIGATLAADVHCRRFTAIGAAGCGELHVQVPLQPPPPPNTRWEAAEPVHRANLRALMFSEGFEIDDTAVYLHAVNLERHRFNSRALSRTCGFLDALPAIAGVLAALWGSEDATAGGLTAIAARRDRILTAHPEAEFRVLAGVGHWSMYEAPDVVNGLLLSADGI